MAVKPEFCSGSGLFFLMIVFYFYSGIDKLYYSFFEYTLKPFSVKYINYFTVCCQVPRCAAPTPTLCCQQANSSKLPRVG